MRIDEKTREEFYRWATRHMRENTPSQILGKGDDIYLKRWYIRRNAEEWPNNLYIHLMLRSDADPECHDHPFDNVSVVLDGGYNEEDRTGAMKAVMPGDIIIRSAETAHRIVLTNGPSISLFLTGPKRREWGFWRGDEWIHSHRFFEQREQKFA